MLEPHYRKRLNEKQLNLLMVFYNFRFGTTELLSKYEGNKDTNVVYRRLRVLYEQGYIGRFYEPEYRLRGQHAVYFLLGKGIRSLRKLDEGKINPKVLHNIHRDKSASEEFIERNLAIFEAYISLKNYYGDSLHFATKSDFTAHELKPEPDALLKFDARSFFLEVFPERQPPAIIVRRIKQYIQTYEKQSWASVTGVKPALFCICSSNDQQKRVQKRISEIIELNDVPIYMTLKSSVLNISEADRVWFDPKDDQEPFRIQEIASELE